MSICLNLSYPNLLRLVLSIMITSQLNRVVPVLSEAVD